MNSKTVAFAIGALLIGLVLGLALGGGGDTDALVAETKALAGKVEGLDAKVGGIETAMADLKTAQDQATTAVGERLEAVSKSIGDSVAQSVAGATEQFGGVSKAVSSQIEEIKGRLVGIIGGAGQGDAAAGGAAAAASGTPLTPGNTAAFGDGKVRVFLSAADADAGTARVAINGQTLVDLERGKAVEAEGCKVTLTGFDAQGAALIDGGC